MQSNWQEQVIYIKLNQTPTSSIMPFAGKSTRRDTKHNTFPLSFCTFGGLGRGRIQDKKRGVAPKLKKPVPCLLQTPVDL